MKYNSVNDKEFRPYGKVLTGYDVSGTLEVLNRIPLPENGTAYTASVPELEKLPIFDVLSKNAFGGLKIQLGTCVGHNTKLNCLEYHRVSEIIIPSEDAILLMAKLDDMEDYVLDSSKVKAFKVKKGTVLEIYATTLHYAACNPERGYRIAVALPDGTNRDRPAIEKLNAEDALLWGSNNWLIAHTESAEAKIGAYVGIVGENIEIRSLPDNI